MTGLALGLALLLALAASGYRATRRFRLRRRLAQVPGGSRGSAIEVNSFGEIEDHLQRRECRCGGLLASHGERSENQEGRVLRVARVECRRCEDRGEVWFDVTRVYH